MLPKLILGLVGVMLAGHATAQPRPMNLIITPGDAARCGHDYSNASAWMFHIENGSRIGVMFWIRGVKPNHLHTIWLKLAAPSPLSGAPATPASPISGIQTIINSADTASDAPANAFYTNAAGNALVWIPLDFSLLLGMYPFSVYDPTLADVPIGSMPFTFRVISHCTDNMQHGLVPGVHESTFDISPPR